MLLKPEPDHPVPFVDELNAKGKLVNIEYECDKCGLRQLTYAFRERENQLARTCAHNINAAIVTECKMPDSDEISDYIEYTDMDMIYEYSSHWEGTVTHWWNLKRYGPNSSDANIKQGLKECRWMREAQTSMAEIKQKFILRNTKVQEINPLLFDATFRQIDFYEKCLEYWAYLNQVPGVKVSAPQIYRPCRSCGVSYWVPVLYTKRLIGHYARKHMTYLHFGTEEQPLVCARCMTVTLSRATKLYNQLPNDTVNNSWEWRCLSHFKRTIFTLNNVGGDKWKLFLCYFNQTKFEWCHAKVDTVFGERDSVIQVTDIKDTIDKPATITLDLSVLDSQQYFVYQRPGGRWSLLWEGDSTNWVKPMVENDIYINMFLACSHDWEQQEKLKLWKKCVDGDVISLSAALPICQLSKPERGKAAKALMVKQVIHTKVVFDWLMHNDMI